MFKQARPNALIYILNKGQEPFFETAIVQQVSPPRIAQVDPQQPAYQYPPIYVVDIVAKVNNDVRNLKGLPAEADISDYSGNVVVTLNKEKILQEVRSLYKVEDFRVNDHENAIKRRDIYRGMLEMLNPEEAERKRNADRIASLESALKQQTEINQQMMAQLQVMMSKIEPANTNTSAKTNKAKDNA